MLGVVLWGTKSGRIVGVANHQVQMSCSDHHATIDFLQLKFTLYVTMERMMMFKFQLSWFEIKLTSDITFGETSRSSLGSDCSWMPSHCCKPWKQKTPSDVGLVQKNKLFANRWWVNVAGQVHGFQNHKFKLLSQSGPLLARIIPIGVAIAKRSEESKSLLLQSCVGVQSS